MRMFSILMVFIFAGPVVGQINSRSIEKIQEWVDSRKGRLAYKKAGDEFVMPRLTKSTKFGFLKFEEKVIDKGRRYYWKPVKSGKDVKMVGYKNWKTEDVYGKVRINGVDVVRVVDRRDIPGKYKTGEVHLIRNTSLTNLRDDLESKLYYVVKGAEYKAIGRWSDIVKRLRPPKSDEQLKEERKQKELKRKEAKKAREAKKKEEAAAQEKADEKSEKNSGQEGGG